MAMKKVKNTIPVYDICSLGGNSHKHGQVLIQSFAGYLKQHPNLCKAHGHTFYHILLFTKGGGYHTIDFEKIPVKKGEIYFMVPGQVHSWEFEGDVDGYIVNFDEELFRSFVADSRYLERFPFFSGNTTDGVVLLPAEQTSAGIELLQAAEQEIMAKAAFNTDKVCVLLLSLFIMIARTQNKTNTQPDKAHPSLLMLHNFRKLLGQYYHQYKLPKEYAAMLYVTPNHLNALCKDLQAKRELVNMDTGIADIAYKLGFADNSYFTKFFKKYAGITPEAFRSNWHNHS